MRSLIRLRVRGFTLVELMIVVVILGILAAIAIPAFVRYVKRSKTTEAIVNVSMIYQGEMSYHQSAAERLSEASFVSAAANPSTAPSTAKYTPIVGSWNAAGWREIGFSLNIPHYFQYSAEGTSLAFTATAQGDLDGDSARSTFSRAGTVVNGEVQGSPVQITEELE